MAEARRTAPHRVAGRKIGPSFGPVQAHLFDLAVLSGANKYEQAAMEKEQEKHRREAEREFRRGRGFDL